MRHPDRKECYRYLREYGTPPHVVGHCKSVAAVAYTLGRTLNEHGGTRAAPIDAVAIERCSRGDDSGRAYYRQKRTESGGYPARPFDLKLILAAGLLHDMARVDDRHWDLGADFCENRGFHEEAKLIRVHMHYEFGDDADRLTEIDLLCLGDRLSLEDRYAGIDRRMDYIIAKSIRSGNPQARPRILAKKEQTRKLLRRIEERIGSIDELMTDIDYEDTESR